MKIIEKRLELKKVKSSIEKFEIEMSQRELSEVLQNRYNSLKERLENIYKELDILVNN